MNSAALAYDNEMIRTEGELKAEYMEACENYGRQPEPAKAIRKSWMIVREYCFRHGLIN